MARIEKTVFISYRRKDVSWALAVYQDLMHHGYDAFFDFTSISSGDFEHVIISNIKARAHFVLILTPTAFDRCSEPGDWLRREIETAVDEKRNIIPLFFGGFSFGAAGIPEKLTGKLGSLSRYNGMNVHQDYFLEAMTRLRTRFLSIPLDTVLHPMSAEVQEVVLEEQRAANKAALQVKVRAEFVAIRRSLKEVVGKIKSFISSNSRVFNTGWVVLIGLLFFGITVLLNNLPTSTPETTTMPTNAPTSTSALNTPTNAPTSTSAPTEAATNPPPTLGIGSTMISEKDGMVMVFVPAGEFTMGSDAGESNERPVHRVYLDSFWIDQTEVTNAMYAKCVQENQCEVPTKISSYTRPFYFGNSNFDYYPVVHVSWSMASAYCSWAGRRLPSEAEWEKAARGTNGAIYPWGESISCSLANYWGTDDGCIGDTSETGKYLAGISVYGAHDMTGNVWEWVSDWYLSSYYSATPLLNPRGPNLGESRVARGGAWSTREYRSRSTYRNSIFPETDGDGLGFRCSISP